MKGIKRDWEVPIFSCIRRMTKTNLKLCQKVTWMRMRASSVQQFLCPGLGSSRAAPSGQGCWDSLVPLATCDFCSWARGLCSHGHPWRAVGCHEGLPKGTGQEAPAVGSGVMERAVEVTRGAGGCGSWVERGTWVFWRGNFGAEVVVKDLLWQDGDRAASCGIRSCKATSVLWNPLKMGIQRLTPHAGYLHMEVLPSAADVSRQVRRGPHALQRRCPIWQSWNNTFRVKDMPGLRGVRVRFLRRCYHLDRGLRRFRGTPLSSPRKGERNNLLKTAHVHLPSLHSRSPKCVFLCWHLLVELSKKDLEFLVSTQQAHLSAQVA